MKFFIDFGPLREQEGIKNSTNGGIQRQTEKIDHARFSRQNLCICKYNCKYVNTTCQYVNMYIAPPENSPPLCRSFSQPAVYSLSHAQFRS